MMTVMVMMMMMTMMMMMMIAMLMMMMMMKMMMGCNLIMLTRGVTHPLWPLFSNPSIKVKVVVLVHIKRFQPGLPLCRVKRKKPRAE
eukprot:12431530-Karenia_brevis.AAC.1